MAYIIHAAPRLTHKYRDGWAHEDQWGNPITFKVLAPRMTEAPGEEEYDEGGTHLYRVIGHKRMDKQAQVDALRSYFNGSKCRHEHDCCGCATTYANVRPVGRGQFSVRVRLTFNY